MADNGSSQSISDSLSGPSFPVNALMSLQQMVRDRNKEGS